MSVAYNIIFMVVSLVRLPFIVMYFMCYMLAALCAYTAEALRSIPTLFKEIGDD